MHRVACFTPEVSARQHWSVLAAAAQLIVASAAGAWRDLLLTSANQRTWPLDTRNMDSMQRDRQRPREAMVFTSDRSRLWFVLRYLESVPVSWSNARCGSGII